MPIPKTKLPSNRLKKTNPRTNRKKPPANRPIIRPPIVPL